MTENRLGKELLEKLNETITFSDDVCDAVRLTDSLQNFAVLFSVRRMPPSLKFCHQSIETVGLYLR